MSSTAKIVAAYVTCAVVWGTTWSAIRACIGPGRYPTFEAAALRFAIAAAILIALVLVTRARPWPRDRRQWGWLILAGVLDGLGYALVYLGEEEISGGLAAVLFGTQPLILAVLATVTGMERITRGDVLGAVISLAGVLIISLDRLDVSAQQAVGVACVLGSVVVATLYSMVVKRHGNGVNALIVTTIFITVTAIALTAAVLVRGVEPMTWPPPTGPTLALLYLAVFGSVIAFLTYFWLLDRVSLMTTSTLVFVLPIIALGVDAFVEHEVVLGGRTYAGIAVTLGGLAVSLAMRARAGLTGRPRATT